MNNRHLSDEEFSDLLAGTADETVWSHLQVCEECRGEADRVRDSLAAMNDLGLLWAERAAPAHVPTPLANHARTPLRRLWTIPASLAALLVILFALNISHKRINTVAVEHVEPSAATLAQDNDLMVRINRELSTQVVPQVSAGELRREAAAGQTHAAEQTEN
jgi:hypothetical protein